MTFKHDTVSTLIFDYGNTLIEFGRKQLDINHKAIAETLVTLFGDCDIEQLKRIRDRQILAPYRTGFRENVFPEICGELIRQLYDETPDENGIKKLTSARYDAFVDCVSLPDGVLDLLEALDHRYRLALLSNYPCGQSIRDSLDKIGLTPMFETVVVSGDVGYVKPHPRPFEVLLNTMAVSSSECVLIGDNWLADIQGAKQMGMQAILTTQYESSEQFKPRDGDHEPDARIRHINELRGLLSV